MKIVIMRHGQPLIDLESMKKNKISPDLLGEIVNEYELGEINRSITPPEGSLKIGKSCNHVISSDLPRAIDSIAMLGLESKNTSHQCFRESGLPYLAWQKPKLSFFTWAIIFRVAWLFGFSNNGESIKKAKGRAVIGAAKLHKLAHENDSVFLLGHGIINRLLAKQLKTLGWKKVENTGEKYWSYTVYELTT